MPAGTIALTNNSTVVTGTGTAFTSELKANDFLVAVVGGVTYTLGVASVTSDTALVLKTAYNGPAASGQAWTPIPNGTLVGITSQVAADVAKAIRGLNLDKANWQQVFSGTGNITVTLPDGSQFTGPAWNSFTTALGQKAAKGANGDITSLSGLTTALSIAQGGTGKKTAGDALGALGGFPATGGTITGDVTLTGSLVSQGFSSNSFQGNTTITGASQNVLSLVTSPNSPNLWLNFQRIGGATGWRMGRADGGGFVLVCDQTASTAMSLGVNDKIYSTANTTKASNGVLSAASPVCRIVKSEEDNKRTDISEDSFEWCGCGTANDEARGISISRLDVGVYKIVGSEGFAKEGWYLMPPRDPAGSGDLGIAEGEETESGGLTIRLYKRRYVLSDEGEIELTKGAAIDVPANSWIDVRLSMPEDSVWNKQLKETVEEVASAD